MTETPTVVPPVVTPEDVVPPVAVPFALNKLVLLGLIGMVGALALLLFQAMHERDELRQRAYTAPLTTPNTANGKYDGPVTAPEDSPESHAGTSSTEV